MKIAHIGNVALKANGVGEVITNLSMAQRQSGHDVMVLTAKVKKEDLPLFTEIHSKSGFKNLIEDFNPDIFVFHSLYIWEYIKFYKILSNLKIPYLIELHGALSEENYKKGHFKKWMANILFYNKFLKGAERIIYLNKGEYNKSIVKQINPSSAFIPNGCVSHESEIGASGKYNGKIEILYLGRIDIYHKALDILLDALQKVRIKLSDKVHFSFYGIGEDNQLEKFKLWIEPLKGFADYYGTAYGQKKADAFNGSDIFILTSRSEGMPMSVLEAISYGLPCIVTPATNMADIIEGSGCGWVTDIDSERIAKKIEQAVKEYALNSDKYIKACKKTSRQFTWDNIAKQTIDLYTSVIKNT